MSTAGTKNDSAGSVERVILQKPYEIDRRRVFVKPPIVHIGNGDSPKTIRLDNQTGGLVKIWLPNADAYLNPQPGTDFSKPMEVDDGGKLDLFVKVNPKPKEGHYQYHVYCEVIKDFAEGNSPPVLHCPWWRRDSKKRIVRLRTRVERR